MNGWDIVLFPYDCASRYPGTSTAVGCWSQLLVERGLTYTTFPRELGPALPSYLEAEVYHSIRNNKRPLTIGGDHSLTYFTVKALTDCVGCIDIVLFDAHHDSYSEVNLSHYSVFHHIQRFLDARLVVVGCRYDVDLLPPLISKPERPTYISVDLDFFDPRAIPNVNHPVDCDDRDTVALFNEVINSLNSQIVGADIVEWLGSVDANETAFVGSVLDQVMGTAGT